jgi:hypothetical protein
VREGIGVEWQVDCRIIEVIEPLAFSKRYREALETTRWEYSKVEVDEARL